MNKDEKKAVTLTRKEVTDILASDNKDFTGLDMRKANLVKLDFSDCKMVEANLSYANLKECNFTNCDLKGASLWNANLELTIFNNANLEDADLDYAKLRGAILFKANIRRATLPTDLIPREDIMSSVQNGTKIGTIKHHH